MAYLWGDVTLNINLGSYNIPAAENNITEIGVLPALGDVSPSSILQQGGRGRYRISFDCFVYTKYEYDSYMEDYLFGVERVFLGHEGETMPMMIEKISPSQMPGPGIYQFSLTLVES